MMPYDTPLRAASVLKKLLDTGVTIYNKENFLGKISWELEYSAPNSALGILRYMEGGELVYCERRKGFSQVKMNVPACKEFVKRHEKFISETKDQKVQEARKS